MFWKRPSNEREQNLLNLCNGLRALQHKYPRITFAAQCDDPITGTVGHYTRQHTDLPTIKIAKGKVHLTYKHKTYTMPITPQQKQTYDRMKGTYNATVF